MLNPRFAPEPAYRHGSAPKVGVLLCNLGTPDAPTPEALRRYLAEFLGDPRVVEIPRLLWMIILHGIILRVRPAKSAHKYASIWSPEGSPLKVWTEKQAGALQQHFEAAGASVMVRYAMTYGQPAIAEVLDAFKQSGVTRVLVLPAYPQYSGTTTAAVFDCVHRWSLKTRLMPEWRFVNHYHDDPGYIEALAQSVRSHWQEHGRPTQLVMSFHGVPELTLKQGDPYHCECHKTGRLLAEALQLPPEKYQLTFQSRFGRAEWLKPYTAEVLKDLGEKKTGRVDVICPGFVSDCLETLEEIAIEGKGIFLNAGGGSYHAIPCLNENDLWIRALAGLVTANLDGWLAAPPDGAALESSRLRARALGPKA
mgnify:CR=1 FL=1